MDLGTTGFERAVHLVLFVTAGVGFGLLAVSVLERLGDGARRVVRWPHLAAAVGVPAALFVIERVYHAVS